MSALTLSSIYFQREKPVLRGISAAISSGEMVGLIGPNGAGKTTLIKAAAGLLPSATGVVAIDERSLTEIDPVSRAKYIGYLPQHARFHWPVSVRQAIELGRFFVPRASKSDAEARHAIDAACAVADVEALLDTPVDQLSGGEQMRVHLARLLAGEHRFILADEATASLDPRFQLHLMTALKQHTRDGVGILVCLHDLTLAARFCDRIIVLSDGELVADAPPHAALTPDLLARYFGVDGGLHTVEDTLTVTTRPLS